MNIILDLYLNFNYMKAFEPYVCELENFVSKSLSPDINHRYHSAIREALDGQPSEVLRSLISVPELRQAGVFFTNRHLADQLVKSMIPDIKCGITIIDPACGVGDLLLACARHLPILEDLESTLKNWGNKLKGSDLHPQFIKATKARLALLAIERSTKAQLASFTLDELFSQIQIRDSLASGETIPTAGCIVVNPPYTKVLVPEECTWASGSVSQAALFLEKCVKDAAPGTKIIAILPDVLRTGSRYLKWRDHIENFAKVESIEIIGRFDALTDVDVFISRMTVEANAQKQKRDWWQSNIKFEIPIEKVEDYFEVRVGPVVPHRHLLEGPSYPYIDAHRLPTWESIEANFAFRRFSGTTFIPPFVVVRRTSRPEDKYRATGTIITGATPVAVENHLIVLKPKSNSLNDCLRLLKNLRSFKTNTWLNERIRCRHLTVSALRTLPWWTEWPKSILDSHLTS